MNHRLLILLPFFHIGCQYENSLPGQSSMQESINKNVSHMVDSTDYSEIIYELPESNYLIDVKIVDIQTKKVKNAFESKKDKYSAPKKVDGYRLKIFFTIKNSYDESMMIPIPTYYWIASANGSYFSSSTTFSRGCQREIDNSSTVTDSKGKYIYMLSQGKCGYDNSPCLKFNPKETKKFIVEFDDPVYGEVRQLLFHGFRMKHLENKIIGDKVIEIDKDKAVIIDIDTKKVIGEFLCPNH